MTGEELKQLEARLWKAADDLRANSKLTASEYSFPVLGLIFLHQAYNRFVKAKAEIEKSLPVHPSRGVRPLEKNDFLDAKAIFLPENAQWETIAELPDSVDIGEYINEAMRSIEAEYDVLLGVLPKDYNLFEKDLLQRLVRIFNDEALRNVKGDVFGRIYEYFLTNFAKSGASEGGEFFTPPSLVNAIVNIIEPNHGTVADVAVGSAGMFVQTAHFIEEEGFNPASKVTFYGQEKTDTNTKLAKMNMAVHGLEGTILQGNTFYEDKHDLVGQCDFIMANPPFNVDGVDKSKDAVKNDPRLPFGLPKSDNANYLWIQYFYSYLNENGRAGFVMASSASDAGYSEKDIREKLVKTGAVDVMVSIGTKFFYTLSLPCTLWFFDRAKEKDKTRANQTLMLDLRDVYRKVSSNLHDFTPEHLKNIHAIVAAYRGDNSLLEQTVSEYKKTYQEAIKSANKLIKEYADTFNREDIEADKLKTAKKEIQLSLKLYLAETKELLKGEEYKKKEKRDKVNEDKTKTEEIIAEVIALIDEAIYFQKEYNWLIERFPNNQYKDVLGLCKVVSHDEIAKNDFSLTAGRYVGVASLIDEDFDYEERLGDIKMELNELNEEASKLANQIQTNLTDLGL